jgi:hypothetical protein
MECGLIPLHDIKQMMLLIASRQNGPQDAIHDNALVPPFAIPDHINLDGSPVFFRGTYGSGKDSGDGIWEDLPPYCDYFYFIESVYWYVCQSLDWEILNQKISGFTLMDRIWKAFHVPQTDPDNHLLLTEDNRRAINFGFVDTVRQTGFLLFSSILRYRSAKMLAEIFKYQRKPDIVATLQEQIRVMEHYIPLVFGDNSGWLKASTGMSSQHDIWGTCFAVFNGLLRGNTREAALEVIRDGYLSGNTCFRGNVRHVPMNADASEHSAWEQCLAGKIHIRTVRIGEHLQTGIVMH